MFFTNFSSAWIYTVTTVMDLVAMKMLSKGKKKVDVLIINVNSSNSLWIKLLVKAVSMDIISLVVCVICDGVLAKEALDNGAYLCLEKPHDEKILKLLRQFLLRQKIQREKARKRLEANGDKMNVDDIDNNNIVGDEEQAGEKNNDKNDVVSKGKYNLWRKRGRKSMKDINEGRSQSSAINNTVKRKDCIE
ncbi:hypothetical protein FXO38_17137 [Capsicum annuum]|nr:hypothetical protein FXO38_17137 [Capsicum annuum]KAF3652843.1 hypothetical protein FXO37_17321 [Capsicum annuum]